MLDLILCWTYDGHKLWVSLTKDEIKRKYERDNPPLESEIETSEYLDHKRNVDTQYPQFLHGIPWMAKEPGVSLQISTDTCYT
ncbi:MAG: hypothetical protein WA421_19015 [Nitrososphaeraceae archaeon]